LADLIKEGIREYFIKNHREGIFITLGILSYPQKAPLHTVKEDIPASITIKEICVGSELRRFKRISYKANIKLLLPEDKTEACETVDISVGGICLMTRKSLQTDSLVKIRLQLRKNKEPVYAQARVAWIKKMEGTRPNKVNKYQAGIEFVHLKNKYRKILTRELKL
jgi:Tfp pilus assembly protein PilZ